MEELRDAKWKSVKEAATAYGIAEMSVYYWMHKLGFEHLKGRLIYVKTRTEVDRIKELEAEVKRLRLALADEVLDHKIDEAALRLMCRRAGTTPEEVKNMIVESKAMRERCEKYCREFSGDERKSVQWKAYLKKNGIEADCPNVFKVIVRD